MKTFCIFLLFVTNLNAAYLRFQPQKITQPDGKIIECFASGDERNNWLHDKNGYTIIQDKITGFYTYAIPAEHATVEDSTFQKFPFQDFSSYSNSNANNNIFDTKIRENGLIPSNLIVGQAKIPDNLPKWLIPQVKLLDCDTNFSNSKSNSKENNSNSNKNNKNEFNDNKFQSNSKENQEKFASKMTKNKGKFCNIVIFIQFADDDNKFENSFSFYDSVFCSKNSPSLTDYFYEISYNQLEVISTLYPKPIKNKEVTAYIDNYKRDYYRAYSNTNPIGYKTQKEADSRVANLYYNAAKFIEKSIPDSLELDCDSNKTIDNITFVIKGDNEGWNTFFWPHKGSFSGLSIGFLLKNKDVENYVLMTDSQFDLGTLCHEFFHTLGAPDLYRYEIPATGRIDPMSFWDLMDSQQRIPQSMCAYMKYKYGNWIEKIPTISAPRAYKLNPLTARTNNAFIVESNSRTEYFVLEYRKPMGLYEGSLSKIKNSEIRNFSGGLLVYKVNKTMEGKGNTAASATVADEIYCYRPDGTKQANGKLFEAAFNAKYLRPAFNSKTNPQPLLFDGSDGGLRISDVYELDSVLHFTLHSPTTTFIKEPQKNATGVRLLPRICWDLLDKPYIYSLQLSLKHNFSELVVNEAIQSDSVFYIKEKLLPDTYYYLRVGTLNQLGNPGNWSETVVFKTVDSIAFQSNISEICGGENYELSYEFNGNLPPNNVFKIQLSNKYGEFENPLTVGFLETNHSGNIPIHIPENIVSGYNYKIRIISDISPTVIAYLSNIRIQNKPAVKLILPTSTACKGSIMRIFFEPNFENVIDCYYDFDWEVSENCEIVKIDDTNNFIDIFLNKVGEAEIKLTVTNLYNCKNIYSEKINIFEMSKINFSGKNSVCAFETADYYFPIDKYFETSTIEIIGGNFTRINNDSIKIFWEDNPKSSIKIIKKFNAGICEDSLIFPINLSELPQTKINGNASLCAGNDTFFFTNSLKDSTLYNFFWQAEGAKIVGSNKKSYCNILAENNFENAQLTLTVTNKKTKCYFKTDTIIPIFAPPNEPEIIASENNTVLTCSVEAVNYQWFCDDKIIENATKKSFVPKSSGCYTVKIFDENNCSTISKPFDFFTSISEKNSADYELTVDKNFIIINFSEKSQNVDYEFYNLLGMLIFSGKQSDSQAIEIPINHLYFGIYYLKLSFSNKIIFQKIIIN